MDPITTLADASSFGDWVWQRHHNVLSWYVRPLFLIPLAWFAYRRSCWGIAWTLVALATSMAWFPAPTAVSPRIEEFLAFEREWLGGEWDAAKILLTLLVPLSLAAYGAAFWRRSLLWGLVVLNVMAIGKVMWGIVAGGGTGWAMAGPALIGLLIGDAVLVGAIGVVKRRPRRLPAERAV